MSYFSNKFLKSTKRWGFPLPSPLELQLWWPEFAWFGQIVFFWTDYVKIKFFKNQLWRHFSDVIVLTSPN